ncbi:MAG: FKBP-type peptidyl-prolyl cis-trans isomerase [Phycisphaerales bacterium JB037]
MGDKMELDQGVIAQDLEVGTGSECPPGATVSVHYRGTLDDGSEFDSNWDSEPATFPLDHLIEGWKIGIPGMKVGGVRKLTIPHEVGYGERGSPPVIPPRATLHFDIKLVAVM